MKFDITPSVKNYKGEEIKMTPRSPQDRGRVLGWYNVIYTACHNEKNPIVIAEEKQRAFKITQRAAVIPEKFKLSSDDLAFLMKRIKLVHDPLIVGRAEQMFEGLEDKALAEALAEKKAEDKKE